VVSSDLELTPFADLLDEQHIPAVATEPLVIPVGENQRIEIVKPDFGRVRVYYKDYFWSGPSTLHMYWHTVLADYPVMLRPEWLYRYLCWLILGEQLPVPEAEPREWQVLLPALPYELKQLGWYWLTWCRIVDACNILRQEPPCLPPVYLWGKPLTMWYAINHCTYVPTLQGQVRCNASRALPEECARQVLDTAEPLSYLHALNELTRQLGQLYTEQNNYITGIETLMLEVKLCL
jgi:hypothetical protein